jgi:hypothetical protein
MYAKLGKEREEGREADLKREEREEEEEGRRGTNFYVNKIMVVYGGKGEKNSTLEDMYFIDLGLPPSLSPSRPFVSPPFNTIIRHG